jgi:hypothetical protein
VARACASVIQALLACRASDLAEFHGRVEKLAGLARSAGDHEALELWQDLGRRLVAQARAGIAAQGR